MLTVDLFSVYLLPRVDTVIRYIYIIYVTVVLEVFNTIVLKY